MKKIGDHTSSINSDQVVQGSVGTKQLGIRPGQLHGKPEWPGERGFSGQRRNWTPILKQTS